MLANEPYLYTESPPATTGEEATGLLVSARSVSEAALVWQAGCDWLDIKEPSLGSLGRPSLSVVESVLAMADATSPAERTAKRLSFAAGEWFEWTDELDGTLAAILPRNAYLKLALSQAVHSADRWKSVAARIATRLRHSSQLILVHYADYGTAAAPDWNQVIEAATELGSGYVLVDTFDKKGKCLLDHYSHDRIRDMVSEAEERGLGVAIAGSLRLEQLPGLLLLGARWIGLRSAVCKADDRASDLCPMLLQQAVKMFYPQQRMGI